jgi:hypothetical protein
MFLFIPLFVVVLCSWFSCVAHGELIAWEGFEYSAGEISGLSLSGGFGFGEAWKIASAQWLFGPTTQINASTLLRDNENNRDLWNGTFASLETRGAMVVNDPPDKKSSFTRLISDSVKEHVAVDKTVFVSLLFMVGAGSHCASFAFTTNSLSSIGDGTDVPIFSAAIGAIARNSGVRPARWGSFSAGSASAGIAAPLTPLLIVARFTWKAKFVIFGNNDVVDVVLFRQNETRSAGEFDRRKVTDTYDLNEADLYHFSFRLENAAVSEVRIGTTFDDVALNLLPRTPAPPTPPPAPTPPPTPLPPTIVIGGTTTTVLTPRATPTPTPLASDAPLTTSPTTPTAAATVDESIDATPALSSSSSGLMPWLPIVIVVVLLCMCGMIVAVLFVLRRRHRERSEEPNNVDMAQNEAKKAAAAPKGLDTEFDSAPLSRDSRQSVYAHAPSATATSNLVMYGAAPPLKDDYDRAPSRYDIVAPENNDVVYEQMQSTLQF